VVVEVGLVPQARLALEVLERGDSEVISGRAVRALVQAKRLADLLLGDSLGPGALGVLAADPGSAVG
jgi:hypothetical protein